MDEAIWNSSINDDKMTEEDWDRYGAEFEAQYNKYLTSIRSNSRRVGKPTASRYHYDEAYNMSSLLPTEREINYYRRALGCDEEYNLRSAIHGICTPHEDTMAAFFLESFDF